MTHSSVGNRVKVETRVRVQKNIGSLPTQVLMTTKLLNSAIDPDF